MEAITGLTLKAVNNLSSGFGEPATSSSCLAIAVLLHDQQTVTGNWLGGRQVGRLVGFWGKPLNVKADAPSGISQEFRAHNLQWKWVDMLLRKSILF